MLQMDDLEMRRRELREDPRLDDETLFYAGPAYGKIQDAEIGTKTYI